MNGEEEAMPEILYGIWGQRRYGDRVVDKGWLVTNSDLFYSTDKRIAKARCLRLELIAEEMNSRAPCNYVVCEIGSNAPGEIRHLSKMATPDIGVITSIGPTHLERLGSLENVAVEKASMLNMLSDDALAVVWGDSDELNHAAKAFDGRMVKFGRTEQCQLRLTDYRPAGRGGFPGRRRRCRGAQRQPGRPQLGSHCRGHQGLPGEHPPPGPSGRQMPAVSVGQHGRNRVYRRL